MCPNALWRLLVSTVGSPLLEDAAKVMSPVVWDGCRVTVAVEPLPRADR